MGLHFRTKNPGSGKWEDSKRFLARSCHIGWAIAIFSTCVLHGINPVLADAVIMGFAFLKEFWADWECPDLPWWLFPGWLEDDTFEGSMQDFCFYGIGLVLAYIALDFFWLGALLTIVVMVGLTLLDIVDQDISPS